MTKKFVFALVVSCALFLLAGQVLAAAYSSPAAAQDAQNPGGSQTMTYPSSPAASSCRLILPKCGRAACPSRTKWPFSK